MSPSSSRSRRRRRVLGRVFDPVVLDVRAESDVPLVSVVPVVLVSSAASSLDPLVLSVVLDVSTLFDSPVFPVPMVVPVVLVVALELFFAIDGMFDTEG